MQPRQSEKMGEERETRRIGRRNVEIIMWGLVLIWVGVTAYSTHVGWFSSSYWFDYLLAGLGVIFFADGLLCYVMNVGQHLVRMVCGAFVLAIGILGVFDASMDWILAVLVAAVGAVLIAFAIVRAKC
ncbi:MAG: hypothetical protein ABSB29_05900 [Nitrososphaerales archaeon]